MTCGQKRCLMVTISVIILILTLFFFYGRNKPTPTSYAELQKLNTKDLSKVDIGLMNLLCAKGLPGAENLDVPTCMRTLDEWSSLARKHLKKAEYSFQRSPRYYEGSFAKCKVINLVFTLKNELKCGYNMDLIRSGAMEDFRSTRFFRNPDDLFIQGLLIHKKGSCSSFPVLVVAIGRRCGLPLYLVSTKAHLFCRWDDGRERFNIEVACKGVDCPSDEYYMKWPIPFTPEESKSEGYMCKLDRTQELGIFSDTRGLCFTENNNRRYAANAFGIACKMFPDSKFKRQQLNAALE